MRELETWHPNLRPAFISGDGGPLLSSYDARFAAGSPPPRNPCNDLWMAEAQRRAAADGVRTLLTGARGNAFFSADDPFWLAALLSRGRLGAFGHEIAALAASTGSRQVRIAGRQLARQLLPPPLHRMRSVAQARRAGISAEVELRFAGPGTEALVRQHPRAFGPVPRGSLRREALQLVTYSGFIAESGAVRDALAGVRRSDPTGDIRVIALCATQPPWARRRDGRTRVVSRDAMADRLPPSIAERTRRGAQLPDWLEQFADRRGELVDELAAARDTPAAASCSTSPGWTSPCAAGLIGHTPTPSGHGPRTCIATTSCGRCSCVATCGSSTRTPRRGELGRLANRLPSSKSSIDRRNHMPTRIEIRELRSSSRELLSLWRSCPRRSTRRSTFPARAASPSSSWTPRPRRPRQEEPGRRLLLGLPLRPEPTSRVPARNARLRAGLRLCSGQGRLARSRAADRRERRRSTARRAARSR